MPAKNYDGFTKEERAAMKEHATAMKAAAKGADEAQQVTDKIAELEGPDRELAERIHAIVTGAAPDLSPKLWYGMPAYAKDGKVLCFFQAASKFKARYATLGFNDPANLDDGGMWATAFAIGTLSDEDEARIADLVQRAAS